MQAFAEHLARNMALPALSSGYKNLVATLRVNTALADAARSQGLDALLASDNPALAELKKGNKELVTSAEKIAEKAMADAVRAKFPTHAIVGEEHGFQPGSDARWVFDPVDGTSAMIRTAMCEAFSLPLPSPTPAFGVTIALVEGSTPTVGLVAELSPKDGGLAISHLYIGDGKMATCDGKNIPLPPYTKTLVGAKLACTVPKIMFGANAEKWGGFQALLDAMGEPCITDQNCIGFMRLLNDVDVAYEADLAYHDAAALIPILQGAGIKVTGRKGEPLTFPESAIGKEFSILAAQPELHTLAAACIAKNIPPEKNTYTPVGNMHQGYASKFS